MLDKEQAGFNMWFTLNENRIRALRDAYELRSGQAIHITVYAMWLYCDLDNDSLYLLNQN